MSSRCKCWRAFSAIVALTMFGAPELFQYGVGAEPPSVATSIVTPESRAYQKYLAGKKRAAVELKNADAAWEFARAAFDWAEFAKNDRQRASIAEEGIAAARRAINIAPQSAGAHYFHGMNLGQLARTKSLGALKLVNEMERNFKKARDLDEQFDHAGPDRNLGLLYLEAPVFSVGDKKKALVHLLRAVELRPDYPENRLNLIEAFLKWDDKASAHRELVALEKIWGNAREQFSGEQWDTSWADWERRVGRVREELRSFAPK